jgi:hypothetical protein
MLKQLPSKRPSNKLGAVPKHGTKPAGEWIRSPYTNKSKPKLK